MKLSSPDQAYAIGLKNGIKEGNETCRKAVLDHLHTTYMSDDVERGTPLAQAILKLAKELADVAVESEKIAQARVKELNKPKKSTK